jgi:hypothetical protein
MLVEDGFDYPFLRRLDTTYLSPSESGQSDRRHLVPMPSRHPLRAPAIYSLNITEVFSVSLRHRSEVSGPTSANDLSVFTKHSPLDQVSSTSGTETALRPDQAVFDACRSAFAFALLASRPRTTVRKALGASEGEVARIARASGRRAVEDTLVIHMAAGREVGLDGVTHVVMMGVGSASLAGPPRVAHREWGVVRVESEGGQMPA